MTGARRGRFAVSSVAVVSGLLIAGGATPAVASRPLVIRTVAGGSVGDGQPATKAMLNGPYGVVADRVGDLFVADTWNNRIRKITPSGIITTVAGTGGYGYSSDGGLAIAATLGNPTAVAVDASGNLYVADTDNHRIRRVDPAGRITTFAGNGEGRFAGDGGPAARASLHFPQGIAIDGIGNVLIADEGNDRIRKVAPDGVISTIAGSGEPGFSGDGGPAVEARLSGPYAVGVGADSSVFVADTSNARVRKIDRTGTISTVAGTGDLGSSGDGGLATAAQLTRPTGLTLDGVGDLAIADEGSNRVRVVRRGIITTVAGTGEAGFSGDGGPASSAELSYPHSVAAGASGEWFVADLVNGRVRRITRTGVISTFAGNGGGGGDGGPAIGATLEVPGAVAVDLDGNLYIAEPMRSVVRRVDRRGMISTIAGTGERGYSGDGGAATRAMLNWPSGLAVDSVGNLYIADKFNDVVRMVDRRGIITTIAGTGVEGFSGDGGPALEAGFGAVDGVAVDGAGDVFVIDGGNDRIRKIDPAGIVTTVAGDGWRGFAGEAIPAIHASIDLPTAIWATSTGEVYIADTSNQRIRKIDAAGIITTVAGDGGFGFSGDGRPAIGATLANPSGVAVDRSGNVYLADTYNHRVRKVSTIGVITTIAGTGDAAYRGDGGPAIKAALSGPTRLGVDRAGNVYVADTGNGRIRLLAAH